MSGCEPFLPVLYVPALVLLYRRWQRYVRTPDVGVLRHFGIGNLESVLYWLTSLTFLPFALTGTLAALAVVVNAEVGLQTEAPFIGTVVDTRYGGRGSRYELVLSSKDGECTLPVPSVVARRARPGDGFVIPLSVGSLGIAYYTAYDGSLRAGDSRAR